MEKHSGFKGKVQVAPQDEFRPGEGWHGPHRASQGLGAEAGRGREGVRCTHPVSGRGAPVPGRGVWSSFRSRVGPAVCVGIFVQQVDKFLQTT